LFDRSRQVGIGVEAAEMARLMGACDVHLLPYDRGGWELTVLETAACGVANIITNVSAPPEYAAPFSILVPTVAQPFGPYGRQGVIDSGDAIEALARLAADVPCRRRLGRRGVEVARAHSWDRIVQAWDDLLTLRSTTRFAPLE
jgi:glycosyltransferase involved in cell wall biosynthesis